MATRSFSPQQAAVIQSRARTLAVRAFAGAGKTTCLVAYAAARPDCKILYVAFTQAVAEEASTRFPSNVTCKTISAVAYAVYGRNYKSKLGSNRPKGLAEALGVSVEHASEASRAVDAFCMSADRELAAHHIPSRGRNAGGSDDAMKLCSALWARMCDVTDRQVLMSHDGYLKLFQLSRPRLDQEFDIILVDEFQDTNPVAVALFMAQSCRKVFVGDDHQSIYAFRGATNAFASIKADETLLLTESYRFGPETARLATLLLAGYKSKTESLVGLNVAARTDEGIDDSKPYAILCRTNAGLFSRAVDQLDHKKIHLIGGADAYVFGKVLDIWQLMSGNATAAKDAFIRSMRTFDAIQDYAKRVNDIEIEMLCGIVADYGSMIPDLVSRIGREAVRDIADAEVILTTAHRSKGLEFEQVVLNDDFKTLVDDRGAMLNALKDLELGQEVHLLYVALTRATNAVQWNSSLRDAVTAVQESRLPIPTPKPATISSAVAAIDGMAPKVERAFFESKASVMAHKVEGSTGRLFGAKPTISSAVLKTSSGVAASGFRRGQPLTSAAVLQPETTP